MSCGPDCSHCTPLSCVPLPLLSLSHHTPCPIAPPHPTATRVPLNTLITPPTSLHPAFLCAPRASLHPCAPWHPPVHHLPALPTTPPLSQHIPHFPSHGFYLLFHLTLHPCRCLCLSLCLVPLIQAWGSIPIPAPCTPHLLRCPTPLTGHLPALRTQDEGTISKPQQIITHLRKQVRGAWAPPALGWGVLEPLREEGALWCHPRVGFGGARGIKPWCFLCRNTTLTTTCQPRRAQTRWPSCPCWRRSCCQCW